MPRLVLALAATLFSVPVAAQSKRVVATVFLSKGEPDADILAALKAEIAEAAAAYTEIEMLSQGELRMRLRNAGKGPLAEAAVLRCGSDLACIAELGRLAAADELLLVRVGPMESGAPGLAAQVLATESQSQKITRRVKLDLATVADVEPAIHKLRLEIFGLAPAASSTPVVEPATTQSDQKGRWWQDHRLFRYGGLGTAGAGGLCLTLGIVYGLKANGANGDINADTDQPRALELADKANTAARRANRFLWAGSVLALLGGGFLGWEMFGMSHVVPAVEAKDGGAQVGVIATW